tara:strand:- start:936 stop:1181 length:246 start_codon:yes stop_codon:yes gene_type:complete
MAICKRVYEEFKIMAARLDERDYDRIVQLMYELYMGANPGYDNDDILGLLHDASMAKKDKDIKRKQKFKLIKGSFKDDAKI